MKVDAAIMDSSAPGEAARRLEQLGYDGGFTFEGPHDPFFPLVLASQTTERIELYTAIAVAFARNPMLLANIGWDLQALSKGRFLLGLGTQVRAHIEKRYSMAWSRPAARMREMVLAIREIWRCWAEGGRLDFRGEFYQHTLMIADVQPGREPVRESADLPGRRGAAHDRSGGRGRRWLLRAPVQQREVDRGGDAARDRARGGGRGARAQGREALVPDHGRERRERRGDRCARAISPRVRSRSMARPRPIGSCSTSTAGAISSPS